MNSNFTVTEPVETQVPIVVSSPHSGVEFPRDLSTPPIQKFLGHPEDTDWFVDRLYDFAPKMGATLIAARYSRYVVDLNRHPEGQSLYSDGRAITDLVPLKSFSGENIYPGAPPNHEEKMLRRKLYYDPYHQRLRDLTGELRKNYEHVLLFDAHSIKHSVPSIRPDRFPDLILGDQNGQTAHPRLIECAKDILSSEPFSFSHNNPFRGGHITRSHGQPEKGIHTLQLEMCQSVYMDEKNTEFLPEKAAGIQALLKDLFKNLSLVLGDLA